MSTEPRTQSLLFPGWSATSCSALCQLFLGITLISTSMGETYAKATVSPPADNVPSSRSVTSKDQDARLPMVVEERALGTLVEELTSISGIRFDLVGELREQRVTTTFDGADWNAAVRTFLKDFNHIAIVERDGRLRRVWITGVESPSAVVAAARQESDPSDPDAPFATTPDVAGHSILPLTLWKPVPRGDSRPDEPAGEPIEMDPSILGSLSVGRPLEIAIPQEGEPVLGVVSESHEQLGGEVQVWSGPIDGSHESASFTISRGTRTTYVTVATGNRIYEVSVDNETGVGQVIDEVDMTRGKDGDDVVLAPSDGDRR